MSMGVVAGVAVAMLLVGFLLGTRARQIVASAKALGAALKQLSFRIPPPAAEADAAAPTSSGADDDIEDEGGAAESADLGAFLDFEQSALDDHPDAEVNPVLLYQIRQEKERQRAVKRLEAIRAQLGDTEGMSEEQIHERVLEVEASGASNMLGREKASAIALLTQLGARFTAVSKGGASEAQAGAERRRLARTVETYLSRTLSVDTHKEAAAARRDRKEGGRMRTAYDVARDSGGHTLLRTHARETHNHELVKYARTLYREWEQRRRAAHPDEPESEDSDGETASSKAAKERVSRVRRGHGGDAGGMRMPTANDIAALREELGGDDEDEDDGEEGDAEAVERMLAAERSRLTA